MDSMEPKVSIIIPYYNCKEFIGDCLNSVINQSYNNLEIIIINDGSSHHDTAEIESLINDSRIVYLKNDQTRGVAFSRNLGLERATGDYVYFLDCDDLLFGNAITYLAEHIGRHPAIGAYSKKLVRPSDFLQTSNSTDITVTRDNPEHFFKDMSILNVLIHKDFIREYNLNFSNKTLGYTDLTGIIPFVLYVKDLPRLNIETYFKRERNDPITNPGISQRELSADLRDFTEVMIGLYKTQGETGRVREYLDKVFLHYYRRNVMNLYQQKEDFDSNYMLLSNAAAHLNVKAISSQPMHTKRELKLLKAGNKRSFSKVLRLHAEVLELKNALGVTRIKKYIYKKILLKLPLKNNYIVFESFLGKNYSDSPRNIYEYIIENNLDFKCIWVFTDKRRKIPGNAKVVKRFSLAYYYYFAVSKYWINNMRQPLHLVKRDGNVFLETWHGTPLKKLVFDMKDIYSANPRYKSDFYHQSRAWDYLLSPNKYSSEVFKSAFKFDKEMLEYGYPRNDILYAPDKEVISNRVKGSIGIPHGKKVILYAPTWRDDEFYEPGKYKFNLRLDLKKMKEKLGDEYIIALRMHYFIADNLNVEEFEGFAYNVSKYDDIAELYLISDILITDYSSVFFDYANLQRPILFYTYDLDKYRDQLRGFYIDFENEAPGPLLRTSDEVIDNIINIDQVIKDKALAYAAFYEKFCSWHDGKATEKVVKRVLLDEKVL
ncbi:CDP-glycerol:glycerophosphate glycerophosphotransferase [Mesobacillus zeae]|nr:CDP-glycerol:glycerophosphate glycerophosphotransferase [Mesobacillus zeae]